MIFCYNPQKKANYQKQIFNNTVVLNIGGAVLYLFSKIKLDRGQAQFFKRFTPRLNLDSTIEAGGLFHLSAEGCPILSSTFPFVCGSLLSLLLSPTATIESSLVH